MGRCLLSVKRLQGLWEEAKAGPTGWLWDGCAERGLLLALVPSLQSQELGTGVSEQRRAISRGWREVRCCTHKGSLALHPSKWE